MHWSNLDLQLWPRLIFYDRLPQNSSGGMAHSQYLSRQFSRMDFSFMGTGYWHRVHMADLLQD